MARKPENTRSAPLDYERVYQVNPKIALPDLWRRAADLDEAALRGEAAALGVDLRGCDTKAEVVERVRDAARNS